VTLSHSSHPFPQLLCIRDITSASFSNLTGYLQSLGPFFLTGTSSCRLSTPDGLEGVRQAKAAYRSGPVPCGTSLCVLGSSRPRSCISVPRFHARTSGDTMRSHHARSEWPGSGVAEAAIVLLALRDVSECRIRASKSCISARVHSGSYASGAGGFV
jgi:hypothetical protein